MNLEQGRDETGGLRKLRHPQLDTRACLRPEQAGGRETHQEDQGLMNTVHFT